jgi:hypothetical protein
MKAKWTSAAVVSLAMLAFNAAQAEVPSIEDFNAAVPGRVMKGTAPQTHSPYTITWKSGGAVERELAAPGPGGGTRTIRTSGTWMAQKNGSLCTSFPPEPNMPLSGGGESCVRWDKEGNTLYRLDRDGKRAGEALAIKK